MTAPAPAVAAPLAAPAPPRVPFYKRLLRDPNPILVRELRATFRTGLYIHFLWIVTALVAVVVIFGGAIAASGPVTPAQVGQVVFQTFFYSALFIVTLVAPAYASTALTTEREARTFESLILSGMSPERIVWGKFLATFASISLVLVALSPVVGVAFLFGGISPWHVLWGYAGLLVMTANAVAFGIAISAFLPSTRVAIVLTLFVYTFCAFWVLFSFTGAGVALAEEWGTGMQGTFWFTDALASRFWHWDTLACAMAMPLFVFLMPAWLFLAAAVAALKPPAEDRTAQYKLWSLVFVLGCAAMAVVPVALTTRTQERGMAAIGMVIAEAFLACFLVLLFINEPPLPPRLVEMRRSTMGPLRRALLVVGPGAAPTLRFAAMVIVAFGVLVAAPCALLHHYDGRTFTGPDETDAGLIIALVGQTAVLLAMLSLGTWLRLVTQNGIAARALVVVVAFAAVAVPLLFELIVDPDFVDHLDRTVPFLVRLTPVGPSVLAVAVGADADHLRMVPGVVVPTMLYGLAAVLFWVLVEARARKVRLAVVEWRARRDARVQQMAELRAAEAAARSSSAPPQPASAAAPAPASAAAPAPAPASEAAPAPAPAPTEPEPPKEGT